MYFFSEGVIQVTFWSLKDYNVFFVSCLSLVLKLFTQSSLHIMSLQRFQDRISVCYFQILRTNSGFVFHCVSLFDSPKDSVVRICMLYGNMYLCKLYLQSLVFPNVDHKDHTNYKTWKIRAEKQDCPLGGEEIETNIIVLRSHPKFLCK